MLSHKRYTPEEARSFLVNNSHAANWHIGCQKRGIVSYDPSILLNSIHVRKLALMGKVRGIHYKRMSQNSLGSLPVLARTRYIIH